MNGPQQGGEGTHGFQAFKDHEGGNHHHDAVEQRHGAVKIELQGENAHQHAGQLGGDVLDGDPGHDGEFHRGVGVPLLIDGGVQLLGAAVGHGVVLDFGNTLHIFDHLGNQVLIRPVLAGSQRNGRLLHDGVEQQEEQDAGHQDQADPPVKAQDKDGDHGGGQDALGGDHDDAGGHVRQGFHGVGGDVGNGAQGVAVEETHGQVAQRLKKPMGR